MNLKNVDPQIVQAMHDLISAVTAALLYAGVQREHLANPKILIVGLIVAMLKSAATYLNNYTKGPQTAVPTGPVTPPTTPLPSDNTPV